MKKLTAVILTVLMLLGALASTVSAKQSFEDTYFPGGKFSALEAPYLVYHQDDSYPDIIDLWYHPADELRALAAAEERRIAYDEDVDKFYGIYDYSVSMQIDAKIDDGAWQYTAAWDDPDWRGLESPYDLAFRTSRYPDADAYYEEMTLSDLYYIQEGDTGFLAPAVYTRPDENGEDRYFYDLDEHTLSVRYRYAVRISPEYGENNMLFSDWSPVTSIGKNDNQRKLTEPASLAAPVLSDFTVQVDKDGGRNGHYFINIPKSVYDAMLWCEAGLYAFQPMYLQAQMSVNNGAWQDVYTANPNAIEDGFRSAAPEDALKAGDKVEVRVRIESDCLGMVSRWSNVVETKASLASGWALPYVNEAAALGLIPDCLDGQDLTKEITRQEFAAVAVKVYESLSGETAEPASENPFTDCRDPEVLKAYNVGITLGTAADKFSPNDILTREQLATMLTRVYKKTALSGWTLGTDGSFTEQFRELFPMPEAFADDADISDWAKDSVYFMRAKDIIGGVGGNKFAPKHGTSAGEAATYGLATREQALKIAVGMIGNLK